MYQRGNGFQVERITVIDWTRFEKMIQDKTRQDKIRQDKELKEVEELRMGRDEINFE